MSVVEVTRSRALRSSLTGCSMRLSSVESAERLMKYRKQTWGFLLTSLTEGYSHLGLAAALLLGINYHNHIYTYADYLAPRVMPEIRLRFFFSEMRQKCREWERDGQQKGRHSSCRKYFVVGIAAWRSRPGYQTRLELWKQPNSSSLHTSARLSLLRSPHGH